MWRHNIFGSIVRLIEYAKQGLWRIKSKIFEDDRDKLYRLNCLSKAIHLTPNSSSNGAAILNRRTHLLLVTITGNHQKLSIYQISLNFFPYFVPFRRYSACTQLLYTDIDEIHQFIVWCFHLLILADFQFIRRFLCRSLHWDKSYWGFLCTFYFGFHIIFDCKWWMENW